MKDLLGAVLIGLGLIGLPLAISQLQGIPDTPEQVGYVVGTFLPGIMCLIFGLLLLRGSATAVAPTSGLAAEAQIADARVRRFGRLSQIGIAGGFALMALGGHFGKRASDPLFPGALLPMLTGWAIFVLGCVNFMRWKGRSGWLGFFGYLFLPGLLILAFFGDRRQRQTLETPSGKVTVYDSLDPADLDSGFWYLLTVVPIGFLAALFSATWLLIGGAIPASQWRELAPAGLGFSVLMPADPKIDTREQATEAGPVEMHKYRASPKKPNELFGVVLTRFPEIVGQQLGGAEKLLDVGKQDVAESCQGTVESEKRIDLEGFPGMELTVSPSGGGSCKARIFTTKAKIYEVFVFAPKARINSPDVDKFFTSFRLEPEPAAPAENAGR